MSAEQQATAIASHSEVSPILIWLSAYLAQTQVAESKPHQTPLLPPPDTIPTKNRHEMTPAGTIGATEAMPDSSAPELTKNAEVQQIPHNNDRLVMIINFLLREVVPLHSRSAQEKLLQYYFRAILSESLFSPYTSLGYSISLKQTGEIKLHDDIYQMRPDVEEVCRTAITSVTETAEKRRFELEHQQIVALIEKLGVLLTTGQPPHALINAIVEAVDTQRPSAQEVYTAFGWKPADNLISVEAARKLELPAHDLPCYAGKKIAYLMPQSEIHKGNMSVLVVTQPVFIPSINRLVLLHDQCFYAAHWHDHLEVLEKLGSSIPENIRQIVKKRQLSETEIKTTEKYIMSQVMTLDEWQTQPARVVFDRIAIKQSPLMRLKEWWKKQQLSSMDSSIEWYAKLVIELLQKEFNEKTLRETDVTKLSLFLKRIVLAGILSKEQLSGSQLPELLALYHQHAHQSEEVFSRTAANVFNFSAAIKSIDTSLLECVSVGTINGFGAAKLFNSLTLQGGGSLSRSDIAAVIGEGRAIKWQEHSTCIGCKGNDMWVGECGLCLKCELESSGEQIIPDVDSSGKHKKTANAESTSRKELPVAKPQTVSVGNFIASFV